MPPKRKGGGGAKRPPVQLTPEAEAELIKEVDFCVCHVEQLKEGAKNEQEFKKYEKILKTLGKLILGVYFCFIIFRERSALQ